MRILGIYSNRLGNVIIYLMIDDDVKIKTSKVNLREGGGATPQVLMNNLKK